MEDIQQLFTNLWNLILLGWSAVIALILGLPAAILVLAGAQVIDIVSGIIAARSRNEVSSEIMNDGMRKKAMAWIIVLLTALLSIVIGDLLPISIAGFSPVEIVAIYYATVECLSIIENVEKAGANLPEWMVKGISIANDKFGDSDEE